MSRRGSAIKLRQQFGSALGTREPGMRRFLGLIGDGTGGDPRVDDDDPNRIWVRVDGRGVVQALNMKVASRNEVPVVVGYTHERPDTLQVIEVWETEVRDLGRYSYVPHHHQAHELFHPYGGDDTTWIQGLQFLPFQPHPTNPVSWKIVVEYGLYPWDSGVNIWYRDETHSFSGDVPATANMAAMVTVSIDGATNLLQYDVGPDFSMLMPPADWSTIIVAAPAGSVPICAVHLYYGQDGITWDHIWDMRLHNQPMGGSVSPSAHPLLTTATHDDTDDATPPAQGSMVVANAGPLWDELVIGGAHFILKVNAGATDPAWAAFDWDAVSAAAGADMQHDHSVAAEGSHIPLTSLTNWAQGTIIQGGAVDWTTLAIGGAGFVLGSTGAVANWEATTSGAVANDVVRTDANAGLRPDRLGVGAAVPDQDGVAALAETADPTNVAGVGNLYTKDDGGETKLYLQNDAGDVFEMAEIVEDVTKTVKAAAGDFTTIQAAINWFKGRLILGACKIDVDAGDYDEAITFEDLLIVPGSTLELEGDTRVLAALSYVDGTEANWAGLANGGTFNDANRCTLATNPGLDQITVSGGTVDPDFDADGWGNGDKILVFDESAATIVERTINSISPGGAGNNVIEITVALAAALGGDGDAILLKPDRAIARSVAGRCVLVNAARGIVLDGWFLDTATGAACDAIYIYNSGMTICQNVATDAEDYGFVASADYSILKCDTGAISAWGCATGYYVNGGAYGTFVYAIAVGTTYGFFASNFSTLTASYAIGTGCGTCYSARTFSLASAGGATARQSATGYYASDNSFLYAGATDDNNNGNVADYNPAPGAIPGYGNGNGDASLYASA